MKLREYLATKINSIYTVTEFLKSLRIHSCLRPLGYRGCINPISNEILEIQASNNEFSRELAEFCKLYELKDEFVNDLTNDEVNCLFNLLDAERLNLLRLQTYLENKLERRRIPSGAFKEIREANNN